MTRSTELYLREDVVARTRSLYTKYLQDTIGFFIVLQGNQRLNVDSQWDLIHRKVRALLGMLSDFPIDKVIWGYDKYKNGYPHINMVLTFNVDVDDVDLKSRIYKAWVYCNQFEIDNGYFPCSVSRISINKTSRKDPYYTIQYIVKRALPLRLFDNLYDPILIRVLQKEDLSSVSVYKTIEEIQVHEYVGSRDPKKSDYDQN